MPLLDIYQNQKQKIEAEVQNHYTQLLDAGIGTAGDYNNKIRLLEKQLNDINIKIADYAKQNLFNNETAIPHVPSGNTVKKIKIFLASSSELKPEREQIEIFINRENKMLIDESEFIDLVIWEDFIDAMSRVGLQKEYNRAIDESHILVCLFFTKVGKYTEEEFDAAFKSFTNKGKPLIYTYFKNTITEVNNITPETESLLRFKTRLKELGHYYTSFENIFDLKYQLKMQLQKTLPSLT